MIRTKLKRLFGILIIVIMTGCSTTTPHPNEVAAVSQVMITRTPTPPLRLPTFSEGFLSGLYKSYPALLSYGPKPDEEKMVQLVPPTIPDFGEILAQEIYKDIPKAFKAWPTTKLSTQASSESIRPGDTATLEVSISKQYASWVHGHLMTFAQITLYSASGEVLMKEKIHVNSLYVQGSKKVDEIAQKGNSVLMSEYQLASSEIVRKLAEQLTLLGFR